MAPPVGLGQAPGGFQGFTGNEVTGPPFHGQLPAPPAQPQYLPYTPQSLARVGLPQAHAPLDGRTERHMRGACFGDLGWAICWLSAYAVCIIATLAVAPQRSIELLTTWFCTVLAGVGVPLLTWICMGQKYGVAIGMLAEFFWWGGIGGVVLAIIAEMLMQVFFVSSGLFPNCNMASRHPDQSFGCQLFIYFQWVLTPGLWEELFKGLWVWARFKSNPRWASREEDNDCVQRYQTENVPTRTCFAFQSTMCTCWWRIAETPVAVWMGALAAGGGFESIENIEYMFQVKAAGGAFANLFRAALCCHVLWTGYLGMQLARRQFNPPEQKPNLATAFLPPIMLHGAWDYVASSGQTGTLSGGAQLFLLLFILITSIGILVIPVCCGGVFRSAARMGDGDPRNVLLNQPRPYPNQQAHQTWRVLVPEGSRPGQIFNVQLPSGVVGVQIPPGISPGMHFDVIE